MMFLSGEELMHRIAIGVISVALLLFAAAGFVYVNNLTSQLNQSKEETIQLKNELKSETNSLTGEVVKEQRATVEIKENIKVHKEETKKIDEDVRTSHQMIKQLQQEYDKFKTETRTEFNKLKDQLSFAEQNVEKLKLENQKLKDANNSLNKKLESKDQEISEVRQKLEKEIDWRNKNYWNRQ